jgi:hypothetical protein
VSSRRFVSNGGLYGKVLAAVLLLGAAQPAKSQSYTFGTASYLAPGTGPTITADFNGDGIPDLAVLGTSATSSTVTVSVLLGRANGTLAPGVEYNIAFEVVDNPSLVAGDFTGDGKLDIVVLSPVLGELSILIGNGDGTFQAASPISSGLGEGAGWTMTTADFNGDGKLDLGFSLGLNVAILFGNGNGTFQNPVEYPVPAGGYIVEGDFNGDGKPDVAVAGTLQGNGYVSVLMNSGDGTFQNAVNYSVSGEVQALAAADINGDGKLDLVVPTGGFSAGVSVLLGNGDGTFGTPIIYSSSALSPYSTSLAVADFNGDGKLDLALTDYGGPTNAVAILLGNGDGTFQNPPLLYSAGLYPNSVVALDSNGDGKPDLAVAGGYGVLSYYSVLTLLNQENGTFPNRVTYPVLQYPYSAVEGDFNGDGKPDVATTNFAQPGSVSVLLGNGNGTFQPHLDSSTGQYPSVMAAGDFNGDGKLDLVVADSMDSNDLLSTLLGNGDGTFQDTIHRVTSSLVGSLAVGDFNNDGKLDVAAVIYGTNAVSVFLGKGDGSFAAPVQYPAGPMNDSPPYHNVLVGDFNGDGNLDLVATSDNGISILLGNGDGTFQPYTAILPDEALLAVGDFNGDGKPDLLVTSLPILPEAISVALGSGNGTFQLASGYQLPDLLYIEGAVVGDFNGDGKLDAVFASQGIDIVTVLLGNGDGTFSWHIDYGAGAVSNIVDFMVAADFNSDGTSDMGLANFGDGTVSVFLSSPVAAFAPSGLSFADQDIGTASSPQNVLVSNPGSASLVITGIEATGDFSKTNTCGETLAIGAKCTVSVTFTPTAAGTQTGTLTFSDNFGVGQQVLDLTGTGVGPEVTLSPASLKFAAQLVGTASPVQTVTLTNTGNAALNITAIATSSVFSQTNTCGSSVAAGASCTISVTFTPAKTGSVTGGVSITDNAPGSPQRVTLSGTGTVVKLVPTQLNFGKVTVGRTSSPMTVTLTNTGSTVLDISGVNLTGSDPKDFSETNTCGASVGAGASCTFSVTFTPQASGNRSADLTIEDNGGGSPQGVRLSGTGE